MAQYGDTADTPQDLKRYHQAADVAYRYAKQKIEAKKTAKPEEPFSEEKEKPQNI